MSKLYQVHVADRIVAGCVQTWLLTGDAVEVEGERMVRVAHGAIYEAKGYHDTLQAAQAAAADQIDAIGRNALEQAACLREAARG